jgi:hypothetical protein
MAVSLKEGLTDATLLIARRPMDRIRDFLPGREGHVGSTAETNRLFVEAGDDRVSPGVARVIAKQAGWLD